MLGQEADPHDAPEQSLRSHDQLALLLNELGHRVQRVLHQQNELFQLSELLCIHFDRFHFLLRMAIIAHLGRHNTQLGIDVLFSKLA